MLNEKFIGKVTAVKAGIEQIECKDGGKCKIPVYEMKLESSDIDYEDLNKFSPTISTVLLSVQPYCFKSCNFGEITGSYKLKLWATTDDQNNLPGLDCDGDYAHVEISNFNVIVKENVPTYCFTMLMDMSKNPNGAFLFKAVKTIVEFEFGEMEKVK
jgi:hypothetical protein